MSRSQHHFLAMLPLFALLSTSPAEIIKSPSRAIANIEQETASSFPKYEAKASKIDRRALYKDPDMTMDKYSEKGEALRTKLMKERADFKVDVIDPKLVKEQNQRLDDLVIGLVLFEESLSQLKEKKAFVPEGEVIANRTLNELKVTLESLLVDQVENDMLVLKDEFLKKEEEDRKKDEVGKLAEDKKEDEPKEEAKKDDEKVASEECKAHEEENKVLTTQVESLISEQKKIMESMFGLIQVLVQQSQMNAYLPYMTGPVLQSQTMFPMSPLRDRGQWAYVPEGMQYSLQSPSHYTQQFNNQGSGQGQGQPYLGQEYLEGSAFYQTPQLPQQSLFNPLPQYSSDILVGDFGPYNQVFNFGPTQFGQSLM